MNYQELWETTMDPEHRARCSRSPSTTPPRPTRSSPILMGEDVESRRGFIQRNARDVRFLDI